MVGQLPHYGLHDGNRHGSSFQPRRDEAVLKLRFVVRLNSTEVRSLLWDRGGKRQSAGENMTTGGGVLGPGDRLGLLDEEVH